MRADQSTVLRLLKTARGQIDGIIRMVEEDRYCMDIVNQILASNAILRKTMHTVLHSHISGCVSDALQSSPEEQAQKIDEIISVIDKISK